MTAVILPFPKREPTPRSETVEAHRIPVLTLSDVSRAMQPRTRRDHDVAALIGGFDDDGPRAA